MDTTNPIENGEKEPDMLKFEDLENGKRYIATGTDGKKYSGTAKYFENIGMIFFCCYPQGVDLVEFEEE